MAIQTPHKRTAAVMTLVFLVPVLVSCAAPTPQVIQQTVVVRETQLVEQTQLVSQTQLVENVVTATPAPKGIVEFASYWPIDSPNGRAFQSNGYRFESEHPECDFILTEYPGSDAYETVRLRAQEGDPPSIYSGGGNSQVPGGGSDWESGYLYDLADDMQTPAYGQTSGTWLDSFTVSSQSQIVYDGHVVAIPQNETTVALFYSKPLYDQFGLTAPTTWGELMANSEVLKQNGIASIGGGGFNGYLGFWYDNILYRLMGNERMHALYNNTDPSLSWTDPEPLLAAQMMADMINKGYTIDGFAAGDYAANQIAFFTGKVGHLLVGTYVMGEVADVLPPDFEFGVTYFPSIEGYEDKTPYESLHGSVNSFGIFKPGANSTQNYSIPCAIEYMKLQTSVEVQTGMVENLNFISAVKGVPSPPDIPGVAELLGGMEQWWPTTQGIGSTLPGDMRNKMWDNLVLLATDQVTPEELVQLIQADYDDLP